MNILRTLKLKKVNGDYDQLNDREKFFLSFFDDLVEIQMNDTIQLVSKDFQYMYFVYSPEEKIFWCAYNNVISRILMEFHATYDEIKAMIINLLYNYLGITVIMID